MALAGARAAGHNRRLRGCLVYCGQLAPRTAGQCGRAAGADDHCPDRTAKSDDSADRFGAAADADPHLYADPDTRYGCRAGGNHQRLLRDRRQYGWAGFDRTRRPKHEERRSHRCRGREPCAYPGWSARSGELRLVAAAPGQRPGRLGSGQLPGTGGGTIQPVAAAGCHRPAGVAEIAKQSEQGGFRGNREVSLRLALSPRSPCPVTTKKS